MDGVMRRVLLLCTPILVVMPAKEGQDGLPEADEWMGNRLDR